MADTEPKSNTAIEPYRLRDLVDGGTLEVVTKGNIVIPVSLALLSKLVSVRPNDRPPDTGELMMFSNAFIEQKCNPYLNECWLVMIRGKYVPIIAAQKRVAKAQSMSSYDGFEWGWIGKEGVRCPSGPESTLKETDIAGAWGRIYFKDRKVPFYHEIFRSEYQHDKNERKITMLMKTLRDQVHKYAFANEMGNLCTENEPQEMYESLPIPECDTPPRAERRKKIEPQDVIFTDAEPSMEAPPEAAVPETDESADGTADFEEPSVQPVKEKYWKLGGTVFTEWAAEVLCRDEEELEDDRSFTPVMIGQLERHLEMEGI